MHVQVMHFLAPLGPVVDHDAETAVRVRVAPLLHCQLGGQGHHVAHEARMLGGQVHHRRDVQLGNDQKVNGRPGRNVVEGEYVLVFMHFARRDLARNDFAENTLLSEFFNENLIHCL